MMGGSLNLWIDKFGSSLLVISYPFDKENSPCLDKKICLVFPSWGFGLYFALGGQFGGHFDSNEASFRASVLVTDNLFQAGRTSWVGFWFCIIQILLLPLLWISTAYVGSFHALSGCEVCVRGCKNLQCKCWLSDWFEKLFCQCLKTDLWINSSVVQC